MRYLLLLLSSFSFATWSVSQEEAKFVVEVSAQEVQVGESFDVKYILENGKDGQFLAPEWSTSPFEVLHSSQSSSFSYSNGKSKAEAVQLYRLIARDTGLLQIPEAVFVSQNKELRTTAKFIRVHKGEVALSAPPPRKIPREPVRPEPKKKIKTIRL
jgi:hypothetical protein